MIKEPKVFSGNELAVLNLEKRPWSDNLPMGRCAFLSSQVRKKGLQQENN